MSGPTDTLPEFFTKARAADEVFWKKQEQRIQGSLGQPCCTLSGISTQLISMPGDFAVVIHGEDECAACFRHIGANAWRFYCVGLTENEFVTGDTADKLRECLDLVATEDRPEAIFVLGACPVEVIGDRFETVVEEVQALHPDIPMVSLHTSGLKVGSQAAMLDWIWSTIASLPPKPSLPRGWRREASHWLESTDDQLRRGQPVSLQAPSIPDPVPALRRIALVGLPRKRTHGPDTEPVGPLTEAGIEVLGPFPFGADFDAWRALRTAGQAFVCDRSLYPKLVGLLESDGIAVHQVPLPTGFRQTDEFFGAIAEATGVLTALEGILEARRVAALEAVERFRQRYGGLRIALGIRMLNNYEADQLAYQGLGDFAALEELGFNITLVVQGPHDRRERIARLLDKHGIQHPFEMFPEPWDLSGLLGGGRFDVAYMADHTSSECRRAGVPHIASRTLEPWYEGVLRNLSWLDRVLSEVKG